MCHNMNNIAPQENRVNPVKLREADPFNRVNKAIKWLKDYQTDIAIFCIVVLGVLLIVGIFRLRALTPPKTPLQIVESN